jgi:hypothetical protein
LRGNHSGSGVEGHQFILHEVSHPYRGTGDWEELSGSSLTHRRYAKRTLKTNFRATVSESHIQTPVTCGSEPSFCVDMAVLGRQKKCRNPASNLCSLIDSHSLTQLAGPLFIPSALSSSHSTPFSMHHPPQHTFIVSYFLSFFLSSFSLPSFP